MMFFLRTDGAGSTFPKAGVLISAWFLIGMLTGAVLGQTQESALKSTPEAPIRKGPVAQTSKKTVLTVKGAAQGKTFRFDLPSLEKLGLIRYTSKNIWYDKPVTYEGVLGSKLLEFVGVPAGATKLKMRALNDYVVEIPIEDFRRWPVMLALKLNGKYMSVREKGPIWVVYPNHLYPELQSRSYQGKWIWQLQEISFE